MELIIDGILSQSLTLAHIKRAITKHITSYYTILYYKNNMHIITKMSLNLTLCFTCNKRTRILF